MLELSASLDFIKQRCSLTPRLGLVLGSGLGGFAASLHDAVRIAYHEIPGMPSTKVSGHAGALLLGTLADVPLAVLSGRVHLYEGHPAAQVVRGVRLLHGLGARRLLLSNAAGGLRADLRAGEIMAIDDHINLTGHNCLIGEPTNDETVRFVDMTDAYDAPAIERASTIAADQGWTLQRGVYVGLSGPSYETPAEVRMLQALGGDAVGMSTVLETIAARHLGMQVMGLSCITNRAARRGAAPLSHAEVMAAGANMQQRLQNFLRHFIPAWA